MCFNNAYQFPMKIIAQQWSKRFRLPVMAITLYRTIKAKKINRIFFRSRYRSKIAIKMAEVWNIDTKKMCTDTKKDTRRTVPCNSRSDENELSFYFVFYLIGTGWHCHKFVKAVLNGYYIKKLAVYKMWILCWTYIWIRRIWGSRLAAFLGLHRRLPEVEDVLEVLQPWPSLWAPMGGPWGVSPSPPFF